MKLIRLILILSVIGALAAGAYGMLGAGDDAAPSYRTDTITRGSIMDVVTANGTLNPVDLASIGTQVSGQVTQLYVKINDKVKAGQLLAEIDPSLLLTQLRQDEASLETARSSYQQAERDLKRTRMLVAKDYVAKVDLERAEQAFLQARNSYEAAKTVVERDKVNLGYAKITSPIDGVVIAQEVTLGQTLAATYQTPNMFKIAGDMTQMKIDVSLTESDIPRIRPDMPVSFSVTAFPGKQFEGKIDRISMSPSGTTTPVLYSVTVLADNKDLLLLPGMTAYVSIIISEKKNVLRVPVSALRFKPVVKKENAIAKLLSSGTVIKRDAADEVMDSRLYVLKDNTPVLVKITTGATDDNYIEVSADIPLEGQRVITGMQLSGSAMDVIAMGGIIKDYMLGDGSATRVLKGIDLTIETGEFVSIMGPSGSGKSSLMNILGTLDRPSGGVYFLDEEDTSQMNDVELAQLRNVTIGFVFQGFNLLPRRTIIDNIALPLFYGGESQAERLKRAEHYLGEMGLSKYRDYYPTQISGGQQQRIAIARALCGEPKLILADEPTGNLDSHTSDEIMKLFKTLNKEGITIVLVTHEHDVARYADRLVHVKDGEIIYDGVMY